MSASENQMHQTLINPGSRHDPNLRWFKDARLGLFIHYSVVASHRGVTEHLQIHDGISDEEYGRLARECDIPKFSAAHWVDQAVALGAKYLTLVCKHHDGFCFWDTKTTDFNIMNTVFGRDLVKEVSDECQRRDIRFVVYCSHPDWHNRNYAWLPGAWGDRQWAVPGEQQDWDAYIRTYKQQITELFTRYGPAYGIWYDGSDATEKRWHGRELYELVKQLAPEAALSDRAGYGDYLSPEWQLDETVDFENYLVEQAISVANQGWAWNRDTDYRSTPEVIDMLVRMIGCGSNLLLNIGPHGDGTVPTKVVTILREVGDWVRAHAEAVYGTEGLRLDGLPDSMRTATRGNDIYVFLRRWPITDRITIPGLPAAPETAELMGVGPVTVSSSGDGGWGIDDLPSLPPDANAQVLKLCYASKPICIAPVVPERIEHWVSVREQAPTVIPVTKATLEGFRVKNFRHRVTQLTPPDAAFDQDLPALGWLAAGARQARNATITDQAVMWADEKGDERHAICDWRGVDQRVTFHVDVPHPMRLRLSLFLRCPDGFGGSILSVRYGEAEAETVIRGNPGVEAHLRNAPNWWQGFRMLPFIWEAAAEIDVPAGRVRLELRPMDIPFGVYVCDLAAVRLAPC